VGEMQIDVGAFSNLKQSINLPDGKSHTFIKQSIDAVSSHLASALKAFLILIKTRV
jgi:hypothetical protein